MGLIKQYLVSTNQRFHIYVKIKQFNYYYYCYYEENHCTPTNLLNKAHSARVKPLQYSICVASLKKLNLDFQIGNGMISVMNKRYCIFTFLCFNKQTRFFPKKISRTDNATRSRRRCCCSMMP